MWFNEKKRFLLAISFPFNNKGNKSKTHNAAFLLLLYKNHDSFIKKLIVLPS